MRQFGVVLPLDLQRPDLGRGVDALGLDQAAHGDAHALALLLGADLGISDADRRTRTFRLDLGELHDLPDLQGAGLLDAGVFEVAVDLQGALLRLEILELDVDARVVLDLVAQFAALLDLPGQLGQALGVEGVVGVEDADVGLIEAGQRDVLELKAVGAERQRRHRADIAHIEAAVGVDLLHGHGRRDRRQRVHEPALHDLLELAGVARPRPERACRDRHALSAGDHPDRELGDQIDPHLVPGDEGLLADAADFDRHRAHADDRDVVDDRDHQRAAAHDHPLAAQAGADEGLVLRGMAV